MLALHENPPPRLRDDLRVDALADRVGDWWIARAKSRQEKRLAWDLVRLDIPYYLPLIPARRARPGQCRRGPAPLFPGYVFVHSTADRRDAALRTNRLCGVLDVLDQRRLARELAHVERLLDDGDAALSFDPRPCVGEPCRIVRGPLAGVEGTVERHDDGWRVCVGVSLLGQGVAVEVDADDLEPAFHVVTGRDRLPAPAGRAGGHG